ncbi:putative bifunctional diguanylate cyclase/phosphodiesterase [Luteimonas kalidii]|uniref:Bifunctional diguanylate cyclase/phosphodiesterase n=1 Tax=Luteimonas kalidii TaxID=3042025 RepID=A0ABT6JT85_9GAMM|nr:bifunctional diguanylate cyclase/phosphodiesterase [Luteimonas kalidii]MDH5833819.1 bifunctional diguanylate cyclase/phosphodiesterase [Luteimonas kalidii]
MHPPGTDELTGLRGRRDFMQLLGRQVVAACERRATMALVVVDVDGFMQLNGVHGFKAGDGILGHLAAQLQSVARRQDYVGRIGDDRFALLLSGILNRGHAELAVQKLFRLLEAPLQMDSMKLRIPVTVGVALCPQHASHAEFLLRRAEAALLRARRAGVRTGWTPDAPADLDISDLWDLEVQLGGAVERGEMELYYQPKLDARDRRVVGAEALMRWKSPSRGLVSPAAFIPVAERIGEIRRLTLWALNTALRQAGQWNAAGAPISVAVNLPASLAVEPDLPELVENALKLWSGPDVRLVLEITEGSIVDAARAFPILARLRSMGVRISIDDFGTGFSCLSYFRNLPADELKIDRSFVGDLLTDASSADLVGFVVALAHRFGLSVAAEGVEDQATGERLEQLGCDVLQGYLFARPMSHREFGAWLDRSPALAPAA